MKRSTKTILSIGITSIAMLVLITMTSLKNHAKSVGNVDVEIVDQNGEFFTDHMEIMNLLNAENTDYILGQHVGDLNLKLLEKRVEANPFVKEAEVFRDIKGNLIVKVRQAKPIARIFRRNGADQYIDEEGALLPTSPRHTARVPLIELERSFSWETNINETDYGQELMQVLRFVRSDTFWEAQIAQITVQENGELVLQPQVTKQAILFGMPRDLKNKFGKLKVFYKEILPNKGWNTYSVVNLKFENQIVCE